LAKDRVVVEETNEGFVKAFVGHYIPLSYDTWEMKTLLVIDCTKQLICKIINEIGVFKLIQAGANGPPCPLHLNPPSVADFPFIMDIYFLTNHPLSTMDDYSKMFS
jgi:hypothetical protein